MPIRRYVEEDVFMPQALETMSKALEGATEALGIGSDEIKRKAVAKLIIGSPSKMSALTLRPCVTGPSRLAQQHPSTLPQGSVRSTSWARQ